MHVYRCAQCGERFESEGHASRCPKCRCKVLIHEEGDRRKACACGGGSCGGGSCGGGCASCGGHCHG